MFRLIKKNYFLLTSLFLILYFSFNLVSGERGLFSYVEKKELLSNLKKEELSITSKIKDIELKNLLLDDSVNIEQNKAALDYVETLIRERFLFGKEEETIYIIKNNDK
jgi:cell division protein DivIC